MTKNLEVVDLDEAEVTNPEEKPKKTKRYKKAIAKTQTVFQMEISECGAASLSMVMGYYGMHAPLEELRIETGVSRNGSNAKNICLAAEHYGFTAKGFRRTTDKLIEKTTFPCIIHWDFSHFLVLEGYKNNYFYLDDPARGRLKVKREEFEQYFTGVVLEILPTAKVKKTKNKRTLFQFAKKRVKGQKRTILALLLLGICLIVPGVLNPVFSQVFSDDILVKNERSWTKWLLLIMVLTLLYNAYFTYIKTKVTIMFKNKMSLLSTDSMLAHLFRLPVSFFEQRAAGDLVQRVQNNIAVSDFLSNDLVTLVVSLFTSIVYFLIMLVYSPQLALLGLGFSTFSVVIVIFSTKRISTMTQKYGQDYGRLSGAAYSGIMVSSSLKAVGAESDFAARVLGYSALVNASDQKLGKIQQELDVLPQGIKAMNNIIMLIIGSSLILDGTMTTGMLLAFSGFLGSFSEPFGDVITFTRKIQQLKNDMGRVDDLLRYRKDAVYTQNKNDDITIEKLRGDIELDHVSFAYGKLDHSLIKRFTMKVEAGKSVALVGHSGSGKSTIAKLLTSLYEPRDGEILFDGYPSSSIPQHILSNSIAVVTQSIVLFEGSIYDNITMWNEKVTQEDVIRAAKDACVHDDITKKSGSYDYKVRDNGANLSGGQKQRIEIAKALVSNPSILVLDEATSSLDTLTEEKILNNIKARGCTLVIVAQRLSTIRDCDEIIVLERGRIIERGTHTELMDKKGKYYELIRTDQS